jgi:hypothetical protein
MESPHGSLPQPLTPAELADVTGGTVIGRAIGYVFGYAFGLIAKADPFDGNYYGVGA